MNSRNKGEKKLDFKWLIVYAIAILLTVYAVSLAFTSNFNMGNLLIWILAAMADVYALWHDPINDWFRTGVGKIVLCILAAGFVFLAGLLIFVGISGYSNQAKGDEKVVIVLGAGLRKDRPSLLLRYRLDKAFEFAQEHPDSIVVTTGGQGNGETVPEGQAMRTYLIEKGLAPERVLEETKSTSTEENFAFAKIVLTEHGIDPTQKIAYVTNAFHCYRAGKYAVKAGFSEVGALPAGIPLRSVPTCYLRESFAILYYWVFKSSESGAMHAMVGVLDMNKKMFYKK